MIPMIVFCAPKDPTSQISAVLALATPQCQMTPDLLIAQAAVSFACDVFLLILLVPAIWTLSLSRLKRLGLLGMVFVGIA